jgi:hypothetical protein
MKIHFCLGPGLVPDRWPDAVCTATHDRMTTLILYSWTIMVCHGKFATIVDQGPARHTLEVRLGQCQPFNRHAVPLSIISQNSRKGPRTTAISHSCGDIGAYQSPVHRIILTSASAYGITSDHFVSRLWSRTGGQMPQNASWLFMHDQDNRWTRDGHCCMGAGSCTAWYTSCIALPAAVISSLGLLWRHPIGCCPCHDNCLAKLPKPGCGTSNKPPWRLIRPQGCHAERTPISIVCGYHVDMSIGLLTLGGDVPDPGRQPRH